MQQEEIDTNCDWRGSDWKLGKVFYSEEGNPGRNYPVEVSMILLLLAGGWTEWSPETSSK